MQNKTIGIATLLLMLTGTSAYILYENIDFSKPVYYCESRIELGPQYCVRFSVSGVRCYPNEQDNKGYRDCSIGWTRITNSMELKGYNSLEGFELCGPELDTSCKRYPAKIYIKPLEE